MFLQKKWYFTRTHFFNICSIAGLLYLPFTLKKFFLVLFFIPFINQKQRRVKFFLFIIISILTGCVATNNPQRKYAKALQKGRITDDTSFVYALPYANGSSHLIVQGYYSAYSHKNRAALDFKMKKGTKVLAARSGVVIRLKEDGEKGGLNKKYRQDGNLVVIQHEDGTRAGYWHLQKNGVLVNIGDTIQRGQLIALSGKTGYTALPHLHFLVWSNKNGQWQQIPTRFHTASGDKYLRPFRSYKNPSANLATH